MAQPSGIVSYSHNASASTLITRAFGFELQIVGRDSFYNNTARRPQWVGIVESGEEQIAPDGGKSTLLEVWVKTYLNDDSSPGLGTERPDIIVQVRGTADSSWWNSGDTDATIAVTNLACTGTNAAWSNTIAAGDDATTVFSLPCLADKARIYIDSTLQVLATGYTITDTKEITLVNPLASGTTLYAYWEGTPIIKVKVGDYIQTSYGYHRISAIPTYNTLTLADYPEPTIVSTAGTHLVAKQIPNGEAETVFGVNRVLDTVQIRFTLVPRYHIDSPDNVRILSYKIGFIPAGERQKKA